MLRKMTTPFDSPSVRYRMSSENAFNMMQKRVDYSRERDENALLQEILACQEWSGGFVIDVDIAEILGFDMEEITAKAAEIQNAGQADSFRLLSTAILLQVLRLRFSDDRDQWEGVTRKTQDWMDEIVKKNNPMSNGLPIMEWAENYVKAITNRD